MSDAQEEMFINVKTTLLRETDKYRTQIRRTLSKENIQKFFDNEKPAALGVVSGALLATLI